MKHTRKLLVLLALLMSLSATSGTLFQVSTGNALMEGLYQGAVDFKTLRANGDFGLGSVEHMDGELVAINGGFYRIDPEGKMHEIPNDATTPYAIVTHFKPTEHFTIKKASSFKELIDKLNLHIENRHIPYAIHLKGTFNNLKLRAVHRQNKPYPAFPKVVQEQSIFNLTHLMGDGVGFFTPPYLAKVNVPGYHIHFITQDRKTGGHILEGKFEDITVELMPISQLSIAFPNTDAFKNAKTLDHDYMPMMKDNFGVGIQTH